MCTYESKEDVGGLHVGWIKVYKMVYTQLTMSIELNVVERECDSVRWRDARKGALALQSQEKSE
jgi:hypothetical protein